MARSPKPSPVVGHKEVPRAENGEVPPNASALGLQERIHGLIRQLNHPKKDVWSSSFDALIKAGQVAVPVLIDALKHNDPDTRSRVAWALGKIGALASPAVRELVGLLGDGEAAVRGAAAWALGMIGASAVPE